MNKQAKSKLLFGLVSIAILVALSVFVYAGLSFFIGSPTSYTVTEDNYTVYNFTINNSWVGATNITNVTVILYGGLIRASQNDTTNSQGAKAWGAVGVNISTNGNTTLISWYNSSGIVAPNSTNMSFWFNASNPEPGTYSPGFIIYITNMTGLASINQTNIAVIVLDTKPNVSAFDAPRDVQNFTATTRNNLFIINTNVTVKNGGLNGSISFNVTNSSGAFFNLTNATIVANTNLYNATLNISNTTIWPDGIYTITVWANDSRGNVNNTLTKTFRIDTTAPTVSIGTTASSTTSTSITAAVTASDPTTGLNGTCISNRGTATTSSITDTGLACNTGYTYVIACFDYAGNSVNSSAVSLGTSSCSTGSSSGSGSSSTISSTSEAAKELTSTGYTKKMIVAETLKFNMINAAGTNEQHSILVQTIKNGVVTIKVASDPQIVELRAGEEKKVEVNSDGYYDISVKLNAIVNGAADLTIKTIKEAVSAGAAEVATVTPTTTPETPATKSSTGNVLMWVAIGIVILLLVAWGIVAMSKNKGDVSERILAGKKLR